MGEEIAFERIVAVANVYDALILDRPYRRAFPREKTFEMIREIRDTKLDPAEEGRKKVLAL